MGAETRSAETTSAEEAETRRRRLSSRILRWLDTFFFVFAGIASFWFAWLLLVDTLSLIHI